MTLESVVAPTTIRFEIPMGFNSEAQDKRSAVLGRGVATIPTPTGLYILPSVAPQPGG